MRDGPVEVDDAQIDLDTGSEAPPPATDIVSSASDMWADSSPVAPDDPESATLTGPDSADVRPERGAHYRRRPYHWLLSWVLVIVVAAGVAAGLRLFVVQTFFVPTGSMIPNLLVGDRILVLKVGYTVDRGSILVFRRPPHDTDDPSNEDLVKRVIGLPGETIWSRGNTIYINGKPIAQPWLPKGTLLGEAIRPEKIPAGDFFMMGDNRTVSYDSRDWGFLPRSYVIGKVILIIWQNGAPAFHLR